MPKNIILFFVVSICYLQLSGCAHQDLQANKILKGAVVAREAAKENTLEMYVFPTQKNEFGYRVEFEI